MKYKAIFLDLDHTLCDTKRADTLALQDFERELSYEFSLDIAHQIGIEYLSAIYKKHKLPEFHTACNNIFKYGLDYQNFSKGLSSV